MTRNTLTNEISKERKQEKQRRVVITLQCPPNHLPSIDPLGIAVAYLTRLLYWTDATRNDVSVSRLDGTFRKVIAPSDGLCESPRGIVLSRDNQLV